MAASMATVLGSVLPAVSSHRFSSLTPPSPLVQKSCRAPGLVLQRCRGGVGRWRAMVQEQTFDGPSAAYAREMERLSAKESLLLAFKDAGGFESLICGKTTEMQRIDISERIVALERLNPTTGPTTSPFLEGRWNFEWFSATSPASFAARFLFERSPPALANLLGMDVLLKDGYSNITTNIRFFNSIESKFLLSTRLSLEGPARMKEEYVEGILETPTVCFDVVPERLKAALGQVTGAVQQLPAPIMDAFDNGLKIHVVGILESPTVSFDVVPEQLKGALGQVTAAVQQLPVTIRDAFDNGLKIHVEGILESPTVSFDVVPEQLKAALGQVIGAVQQLPATIRDAFDNGLKIPLSGTFERMFVISYLDEEILIIRDSCGTPHVLTRLEGSPASTSANPVIPEYES